MQTPTPEQAINIINLGKKLGGLKIKATFSRIEIGPIVTGYFFKLDPSESVTKIMKKTEDMALALETDKVVIQRIKGDIVLFVPNKDRKLVDFKEVLHWYFHNEDIKKMYLPVPIGVDTRGNKFAVDLTEMPHILLCGATGSGKSVFEASVICALCYYYDSSLLNMYMVDTKRLDLPLFKSLPHVKQVVESLAEFHNMFSFLMLEIRSRLNVLNIAGVRNIQDYHKMNENNRTTMPYIIVLIDEFADLSDQDKLARKAGQYEETPSVTQWLKQASQIARAAGVHIIACTQRASAKIIDGDIKTNLPCRICLSVPTRTDSMVVLDAIGAENLLGKGDMLIKRPTSDNIERYHGAFVSSNDISELVSQYNYLKDILVK